MHIKELDSESDYRHIEKDHNQKQSGCTSRNILSEKQFIKKCESIS